jgi:hypothetical protein
MDDGRIFSAGEALSYGFATRVCTNHEVQRYRWGGSLQAKVQTPSEQQNVF